jgi:hypothetical protein
MRVALAVLAGTIVAGFVVFLLEFAGHMTFPVPAEFNPAEPDMSLVPLGALASVVLAWALGSFAGGAAAARIGSEHALPASIGVGSVQLAFGALTLFAFPHPMWMILAGLALPIPMAWLGGTLFRPRRPG